ncbi:AAA family ATPase [Streptomyces corynorhini]|uniref:AAA family ATPase n=1 Tax=Streptomyces corynorhini TaxID=2282652 RepID=UPI001314D543|nr:helix-turn-helix transcriptional regulator [Streptomyces corynorhini]
MERERELALLGELAQGTAAGRPGLVLLEGPDGSGKSALLRALITRARDENLRVVHARPGREGNRLPLSTARALLTGLGIDVDRMPPTVRPGAPGGPGPGAWIPGPPDGDGAGVPFDVLAGLHEIVRSAAENGPLAIVVDDADEADAASLRFLVHSARRMAGLRVLLALAHRSGAHVPALNEVAALPMCRVLRPRPLTREGIGVLARRLLGTETDAAFHASCLAATNGNPLLVTRLLTALREERSPAAAPGRPASVAAQDASVLRLRAARLPPQLPEPTVRVARALAVLGDEVAPEAGARLARMDSAVFARSLLALVFGGLVVSKGDGNWSFADARLSDTVLGEMSGEELDTAHGRAARLLHDAGTSPATVAEHLRRAPSTTHQPWARDVLREAAREAMLRGSPARATELLRPCVPEGSEQDCEPSLLVELGVAESRVDPGASIRHLTSALERTAQPALRRQAVRALAEALTRQGQVARALELLARYRAETAVPLSRSASAPQLIEAQMLLAATGNRAAYTEMLATVSLDLALPGNSAGELALLAARAVIAVSRMDRVGEAVTAARTVIRHGTTADDAPLVLGTAASVLLYADRPYEAQSVYRRLLRDTGTQSADTSLLALSAEAHLRLGALDRALRTTAAALKNVTVPHASRYEALPLAVRLAALLDRGDLAQAIHLAAEIPDPVPDGSWEWNEVLCAQGRLRLDMGDPKGALTLFEECARRQREWQRLSPAVSSWWYWAGHTHLALGDRHAAAALAEEAVAAARSADLPCALGAGLELWAASAGDEERPLLLEEAEQVLTGTRAALARARVRVARGQELQRLGETKAAREVLRKGWEEAYDVGSRSLHTVAHRALLAAGARPRRPVSRGVGALTQSESQVARLAAEGRSNASIAESLYVTQRTVEVHLTSVYRKLGLSGRRQLRDALEPEVADASEPGR